MVRVALLALLAFGAISRVEAACSSGAKLLRVPEDCATVATAIAALADGGTIDIASGPAATGALPLNLSNLGRAMTLRGRSSSLAVFSGSDASALVLIKNSSPGGGKPIVFEHIRFEHGRSTLGNRAGGVTLENAEASFVDCEFASNVQDEATTGGGALAVLAASRAVIMRSSFSANRAKNNGGAIYLVGQAAAASSVWVSGSEFDGNSTAQAGFTQTAVGGAIYVRDGALRVADSRFDSNVAGLAGGGIYAYGTWTGAGADQCNFSTSPSSDLLITRTYFLGNSADDAANAAAVAQTFGGAIHVEACSRLRLFASGLEENHADWGGAVNVDAAAIAVEQSRFVRNFADLADSGALPVGGAVNSSGGAITRPIGSMTFDRTLFVGGTPAGALAPSADDGGCLRIVGNSSARRVATVTNSVFTGCIAGPILTTAANLRGGGLSTNRADVTLNRVLFAGNRVDDSGFGITSRGGGMALVGDSVGSFTDVVLADNFSSQTEADLVISGSSSSGTAEEWTESPPSTAGILVAAPSHEVAGTAPLAASGSLGWAYRGSSATLDGTALPGAPKSAVEVASPDAHELLVDGLGACSRCAATISAGVEPATTLTASPNPISSGDSSNLAWTTPAGTFLAAVVDRGLGERSASGNANVSPTSTSTYRRLVISKEGGALAEETIYVDETPPDPIFNDGFENGLVNWSLVAS